MNYALVKKILSKIGSLAKRFWQLIVGFLLAVSLFFIFRKKSNAFKDLFDENRKENLLKEKQLNNIVENQIKERDEHIAERDHSLKELNERHEENLLKIEKNKEETIKGLIGEDLASELSKEFDLK